MWNIPCVAIIPCAAMFSYPDAVFTTPSDPQTPISHSYEVRF
jgi:hypothetical protein